jgi:hypothetical protein
LYAYLAFRHKYNPVFLNKNLSYLKNENRACFIFKNENKMKSIELIKNHTEMPIKIDIHFNNLNILNNSSLNNQLKNINPKLNEAIDLSDSYLDLYQKRNDNLNLIGKFKIKNINLDLKNVFQMPSLFIKNSNILSFNLKNDLNIEFFAKVFLIIKIKTKRNPLNDKINLNKTQIGINSSSISSKNRLDRLSLSENVTSVSTNKKYLGKNESQSSEKLEFVYQYDFEIKIENSMIQKKDNVNLKIKLDESKQNKTKPAILKTIEELIDSFEKSDTIDITISFANRRDDEQSINKNKENVKNNWIDSIRICSIERVLDEEENEDKTNEIYYQFNLKSENNEPALSDSSISNGSFTTNTNNNKRVKLAIETSKSVKPTSILTKFVCSNVNKMTCPFCFMHFKHLKSMKNHFKNVHSRFLIKQDKSMNCLFFNVYPNNLNNCSCQLANLYCMNQDQFRGYSNSRCKPIKNIVLTDKLSLEDRLAYNSKTYMVKKPLDPDYDSDLDKDPEWHRISIVRMLEDFDDVNEGEKDFMSIWNYFLMRHECIADGELMNSLKKFIEIEYTSLFKFNIVNNFLLHLANLCEYNLINSNQILEINDFLESKNALFKIKKEIKLENNLHNSNDVTIID